MPRVRRKLKVTEISFVKHPANPAARVALHKSEDGTMPELETILKSGGAGFTRADIAEAMEVAAHQWAEDHSIDLSLTTAQAYAKWLDTPSGRTAYALQRQHRDPAPDRRRRLRSTSRPRPKSKSTRWPRLCARACR